MTAIALLGLTPVVALGWAGCADDENGNAGAVYVDPGGTFGAEVTVSVIGRGRVTTSAGLDCPSDCFAKYIFTSASADGAAGGVSLKASPTPNSRFKGWSFSADPVGSRGRGPENCNPVKRPGASPAVNSNALEIVLPFGETTGVSPAGQEGACGGFTTVPVVYNITATFETDPPVNLDGGLDGGDGGIAETLFNAPTSYPNAINREIGLTQNGYMYWHFQSSGQSGIAYSSNPDGSAPQIPQVIVSPSSSFTLFEVDPYGVVYQDNLGTLRVIQYGSTSSNTVGGVVPTCTAVSIDSSFNVYCRTSSTIVQWLYSSNYTTPITLYTGLPSGTDLVVESASGSLFYSSSSAINSLPIFGADGGVAPTPTTIVSGPFNANGLESNSSRLWWFESGGYVYASSNKSSNTTRNDTGVPPTATNRHLVPDQSSFYAWVASSSAIYRAYYLGGSQTEPFRTGLSGLSGMTADSQYVYWNQSDGIVRRASRSGF